MTHKEGRKLQKKSFNDYKDDLPAHAREDIEQSFSLSEAVEKLKKASKEIDDLTRVFSSRARLKEKQFYHEALLDLREQEQYN